MILKKVFQRTQQLKFIQFRQKFSQISIKERIKLEKEERLKREKEYFPTTTQSDLAKIRNIGIIAHIDAGKTTITERMLFYAGALTQPGEVHDGNTVMDYMPQERERGITIRSAAISFNWKQYQLNLLDTPGHIDFTGEVERALRVMDGSVAVFDAVHGVQTQSEMVWVQANKFNVPRIAFVNKMDNVAANFEQTVKNIEDVLNVKALVVQLPIGEGSTFKGIIDIINMKQIIYKDESGSIVDIIPIKKEDKSLWKLISQKREDLLDQLSVYDDKLADKICSFSIYILENQPVSAEEIQTIIRNTLQEDGQKVCVVMVGSALKNKGIQPLLDGIISYLPSPSEKPPVKSILDKYQLRKPLKQEMMCGLAFKIIQDSQLGALTYIRLYSGILHNKQTLKNTSMHVNERIHQLFRVRANEYVPINEISAGDIAAVQGLKETYAGNTLIDIKDDDQFVLETLIMPEPVFMASFEYDYLSEKSKMQEALKNLCREDNSLIVREDEETGQIIVSGLGELHLQVIRDRMEIEYGVKAKIGKMRVAYRESVQQPFQFQYTFEKLVNNKPLYFEIEAMIEPIEQIEEQIDNKKQKKEDKDKNLIEIAFKRDNDFDHLYKSFRNRNDPIEEEKSKKKGPVILKNPEKPRQIDTLKDEYGEDPLYDINSLSFEDLEALETIIDNSFLSGKLQGYPMIDCRVKILGGKYCMRRTNTLAIEMATAELMKELIESASPIILEPVMNIQISCPKENVQDIMNDLISSRRGRVEMVIDEQNRFGKSQSDRNDIKGIVPLSETIGYATYLRSISKGEASFIMKFSQFEYVGGLKQKELLKNQFS